MIINGYPEELDYVNAILHPMSKRKHGSFLTTFCQAALTADNENYELLRPVLLKLMVKYPADEERLEMEKRDSGR